MNKFGSSSVSFPMPLDYICTLRDFTLGLGQGLGSWRAFQKLVSLVVSWYGEFDS